MFCPVDSVFNIISYDWTDCSDAQTFTVRTWQCRFIIAQLIQSASYPTYHTTNDKNSWNEMFSIFQTAGGYNKCHKLFQISCTHSHLNFNIHDPPLENTSLLTCTSNEDTDQPAHPHSLIRHWNFTSMTVLNAAIKIMIRLREFAGCSESSLGAHVRRYLLCHVES